MRRSIPVLFPSVHEIGLSGNKLSKDALGADPRHEDMTPKERPIDIGV